MADYAHVYLVLAIASKSTAKDFTKIIMLLSIMFKKDDGNDLRIKKIQLMPAKQAFSDECRDKGVNYQQENLWEQSGDGQAVEGDSSQSFR
ncbi:MAG: hypothetical protein OYH77_05760, partial [Pseudomonadota bacterium]|nr:hypothetical protein [Pseudomonadota bacterium]